jgi:type II secretory pathway pseudopilin PulG
MKSTKLRKTFGGFILGVSLVLGIGIISSSTAQAQYRTYDQYERQRQREIERARREQQRNRNNDWWNRNRRNGSYDNYPNYGGSFDFRQTALNAGYNEGVRAGRDDRRHGDRYEFRDEGAYQSASKDYNSRMGDRGTYAAYFRQAFATGYADGYRGY